MFWTTLQLFAAAVIVLLLPGGAIYIWLRPKRRTGWERLADVVSLSIAITAILGMVFFYLHIQLDGLGLAGLYAAFLFSLVAGLLLRWERPKFSGAWLLGFALVLLVLAWRYLQARDLVLPAWVDSVHHVLVVRKIMEFGGLPGDLLPYLPVPFYYHYGFHILAAIYGFWTQLDATTSVMVIGQVINALVSLGIYRLGVELWGNRKWAAAAALLSVFAFHMPGYYITWGRYTLLTGLILLGPAMAEALAVAREPGDRKGWVRLLLLTAGICLSHYLVVGLFAIWIGILCIMELIRALCLRSLRGAAWPLPLAALGGVLLALPWLLRVWSYTSAYASLSMPDLGDSTQLQAGLDYLNYILYLIGPIRNYILLGVAAVGLIFAIIKPGTRILAANGLVYVLLALPWAPRINPFRPDHMAIVLFFPGCLLVAQAVGQLCDWIGNRLGRLERIQKGVRAGLFPAVIFGLLVWGAVQTVDILNPVTIFVTQGDAAALRWIKTNTPTTAKFWINTAAWQGDIYRGVDGGYWITTQTGRATTVPPALYSWGSPVYVYQVNELAKRASNQENCDAELFSQIRDAGVTHIYLHTGVGKLQPTALVGCEGLKIIYQQDKVTIYQVLVNAVP